VAGQAEKGAMKNELPDEPNRTRRRRFLPRCQASVRAAAPEHAVRRVIPVTSDSARYNRRASPRS